MVNKAIPTRHLLYMTLILIMHISIAFTFNFPIYIGIVASIFYIFYIAKLYGYQTKTLLCLIYTSFRTVKIVLFMLILIAAILPLWMASGTLPTLIHYSFIYLSSLNVPLSAFLISTILSLMLGTYIGTLSILGPLFISLAVGLNIPLPLMAGALISGAVIGDRVSPISSNFHLICASCAADINTTFITILKTNTPAFVTACGAYYFFGSRYQLNDIGRQNIDQVLQLLDTQFYIHMVMVLPIGLLLILIMSKKLPITLSFLMTFIFSLSLYLSVGLPIQLLPNLILFGYHPSNATLHAIISGSGIQSMIAVPIIILCSAYLNDLLKHIGLIDHGLSSFTRNIQSPTALYRRTAILSILVTTISCNQSLTAIITGQHFKNYFDALNIDRSYLARTISDTGSIVITIIPWNLNALVAASITGVATIHYAPYAFYIFIPIVMTFISPYVYKGESTILKESIDD